MTKIQQVQNRMTAMVVGGVNCELESCATATVPELTDADRPDSVSRFMRISSERISAAP